MKIARSVHHSESRSFASLLPPRLFAAVALAGALLAARAGATDFLSFKSGNWFAPATWGQPTAFPFTGDNVTIWNGNNVSLSFSNNLYLQINNLVLTNGTLSISSGAGQGLFAVAGADSVWTNATLGGVMLQLGTLNLTGNNGFFTGTSITNEGRIRQTDAGNLNPFESTIVNSPGGTYEFAGDGSVNASQNNSLATFINKGTLLKSSGVNTSSVAIEFENQGGVIEVDSGTLAISYNVGSSNGTFIVGAGATLDVTGGGNSDWGGVITGSGVGQVALRSGSLVGEPVTLDLDTNVFQWTGGGMSGAVANVGVITLAGNTDVACAGQFLNSGLFRHTNTATLNLYERTFKNLSPGTYDLEGDGGFSTGLFGVGGTFENFGLFRKSGGAGVSSFNGNAFDNSSGTLEADSGTLQFGNFSQFGGATRLAGGNLTGGTFNFNGGLLTGFGTVTGAVVNAGAVVLPGTNGLGALNVAGSYQQQSGGALDIALGGAGVGQFSQLNASGSASLAGALSVTFTNGFRRSPGQRFQIVSCSSLSGQFNATNSPAGMSVRYSTNGVYLVAAGAVGPPTHLVLPRLAGGDFNFSFQTANGQTYTVQRNDDLSGTNWVNVTNFSGNGSLMQFVIPATNVPQRFFRVVEP